MPGAGRVVLVRVSVPPVRRDARPRVRAALHTILAVWSGLPPSALPLWEGPRGPVWRGQLGDYPIDISLSYTGAEAWIALLRNGRIGVDALEIQFLPDVEAVTRLYLGPAALAAIRPAADPHRAFALAWTEMEARLKCSKRDLTEWSPTQSSQASLCSCQHYFPAEPLVVAVATCPIMDEHVIGLAG